MKEENKSWLNYLMATLLLIMTVLMVAGVVRVNKLERACDAYEQALDQIYHDQPDYYLDVFCETDAYMNLYEEVYAAREKKLQKKPIRTRD